MINENLDPATLKALTGHDKVFQRVDIITSTDAEKAYSALMMKDLQIGGASDVTMGPTSIPARKAWTKVLFGPNESAVNPQDNTAISQTNSTITESKGFPP